MSKLRIKILIISIGLLLDICGFQYRQALAQSDTGYNSYGDYVEEIIIDKKNYQKQEAKRLQEKHKHYLEMIKNNPKNPTPYHYLGSLYLKLDRPQKAIHTYKNLLNLTPLDAKAHFSISQAFNKVQDGTNAIKHMEKANQIFRDNFNLFGKTKTQKLLKKLKNRYPSQ